MHTLWPLGVATCIISTFNNNKQFIIMYHAYFSLTCLILATEFLVFVKELKKDESNGNLFDILNIPISHGQ